MVASGLWHQDGGVRTTLSEWRHQVNSIRTVASGQLSQDGRLMMMASE
jgi:hypothetical protein